MNPPQALPDPGRINFRLLHYFRVVAEEMNFTQAARRLNMSQPPLSKHIKDLESQLGVVLFKLTTRSMTLTPAARCCATSSDCWIRPTARCIRCNRWGVAKAAIWWSVWSAPRPGAG